jgi:hypothetical protein
MVRNDSLETKVRKIIDRSFTLLRNNLQNGYININRDTITKQLEEVAALIRYFDNKKLYVLDTPVQAIPHPSGAMRLVDPVLRNTPASRVINAATQNFNDAYSVVEEFNNLLDEGNEIFIYSLEQVTIYNPTNFEPTYRYSVRYGYIGYQYWFTPMEVVTHDQQHIPTVDLNQDLQQNLDEGGDINMEIVKKLLKYDFNGVA